MGTCAVVCSLTAYALTTKKDFTLMRGSISMAVGLMLFFGLSNIFLRNPMIDTLLTGFGALLAGFYFIYDI